MTDVHSRKIRSRNMAAIRSGNTGPELTLRRALHATGLRYRLHDRRLPGKPDLVFPKYRAVVLVHGCFWHGHDCTFFRWPGVRRKFWRAKIMGNRKRDEIVTGRLRREGWRRLVVWECAFRSGDERALATTVEKTIRWLEARSRWRGEIRGERVP